MKESTIHLMVLGEKAVEKLAQVLLYFKSQLVRRPTERIFDHQAIAETENEFKSTHQYTELYYLFCFEIRIDCRIMVDN